MKVGGHAFQRTLLGLVVVGALVGGGLAFANRSSSSSSGSASNKPNIVLIVTDDQRWDSMGDMPDVDALDGWARFENAFVNDPQCCPSRASILTGRYTQHTGVETLRQGGALDERRTIATMLDDAGYRTGFFGKYLNGYPFGRSHYVPPGWDVFAAYERATEYFNYMLNEQGTIVRYGEDEDDYSTDVFAAKSPPVHSHHRQVRPALSRGGAERSPLGVEHAPWPCRRPVTKEPASIAPLSSVPTSTVTTPWKSPTG